MARPYRITIRSGPAVDREARPDLASALDELGTLVANLRQGTELQAQSFLGRDYSPIEQVAARLELSGPGGLHCGVDVRGDGSAEAWTGRWRRRLVEQQAGELSPVDALRRVLTPSGDRG